MRRLVSTSTSRSAAEIVEQPGQRGQVELVLEALTVGLEDDRKVAVLAGHLEQSLRLQPLLPERGALAGAAARDQGARPAFSRKRAPKRRAGELPHDEVLDLLRIRTTLRGRRLSASRRWNAIPSSDQMTSTSWPSASREPATRAIAQGAWTRPPSGDRTTSASRRSRRGTLDHDRPVGGDAVHRLLLLGQVGDEVLTRPGCRAGTGREGGLGFVGRKRRHQADELADCPAGLERPPGGVAVPERHVGGRSPRLGNHLHPVVLDVDDAPRAGAEQEDVTRPALVDHLLVELADSSAVREGHSEQPPVGDGASVGYSKLPSPRARGDGALDAVPGDPRAQLGEEVGGVATRQHVERRLERPRWPGRSKEALRRTTASRSAAFHGSTDTIDTTCWASTSRGCGGSASTRRPGPPSD